MSLLLKVEHISYTMGTSALPDIYTLAHGITITYPPYYTTNIFIHIYVYIYIYLQETR